VLVQAPADRRQLGCPFAECSYSSIGQRFRHLPALYFSFKRDKSMESRPSTDYILTQNSLTLSPRASLRSPCATESAIDVCKPLLTPPSRKYRNLIFRRRYSWHIHVTSCIIDASCISQMLSDKTCALAILPFHFRLSVKKSAYVR